MKLRIKILLAIIGLALVAVVAHKMSAPKKGYNESLAQVDQQLKEAATQRELDRKTGGETNFKKDVRLQIKLLRTKASQLIRQPEKWVAETDIRSFTKEAARLSEITELLGLDSEDRYKKCVVTMKICFDVHERLAASGRELSALDTAKMFEELADKMEAEFDD